MPTLYEGLTQAFTDPMMGVAAGLLGGAAPGGSLGQGLQQGLILSQQMQMNNARQDMATRQLTQRIEEQRWKRMAQEREWETERLAREQAAQISGQYGIQPGLEPTGKMIQTYSGGARPGTPEWAEAMQPTPQVAVNVGQGMQPPGPAPDPGEIYWDGKSWKRMPEESESKRKARSTSGVIETELQVLEEAEADPGFDPAARISRDSPLIPRSFQSGERQVYDDSAQAVTDQLLTYWSGAEIKESEIQRRLRDIKIMPGDTQAAIKRKQERRRGYVNQMREAQGIEGGSDLPSAKARSREQIYQEYLGITP